MIEFRILSINYSKVFRFYLFFIFLFSLVESHAFQVKASGFGGIGYPDYEDVSVREAYGASGNYFFDFGLGIGGFALSSPKVEDFGRFQVSLTGADISFDFKKWRKGSVAGLRLGLAEVTWEPIAQTLDTTPFFLGAYYSHSWMVNDNFGYGIDYGVYSINGDGLVIPPDTEIELESFLLHTVLFSVSLWI